MSQETKQDHRPLTDDQIALISKRWTVKDPFFLAICERCGTIATSEIFGLDGETIYCPKCQSNKVEEVSQDRFPVLGLLATIESLQATIEAQSRLLAQAETLVNAAGAHVSHGDDARYTKPTLDALSDSLIAYEAALTEYQTTGTVPCGECEAKREVLRDADKRWAADRRRADRAEEERDDLRRQLAEADRLAEQRLAERNSVQEELDALKARDERSIKALCSAMTKWGYDATSTVTLWNRFLDTVRAHMEPEDRPYFDAIRNREGR